MSNILKYTTFVVMVLGRIVVDVFLGRPWWPYAKTVYLREYESRGDGGVVPGLSLG